MGNGAPHVQNVKQVQYIKMIFDYCKCRKQLKTRVCSSCVGGGVETSLIFIPLGWLGRVGRWRGVRMVFQKMKMSKQLSIVELCEYKKSDEDAKVEFADHC